MPKTAPHPRQDLSITFHEDSHLYVDNRGQRYKSVTELVEEYSEDFDAETISRRKAERELEVAVGVVSTEEFQQQVEQRAQELREQWGQKRDAASSYGTRVHETAEELVKGNNPPYQPQTSGERHAFSLVWEMLNQIRNYNDNQHWWVPEVIVFSPRMGIAGTIDLLAYTPTGAVTLCDWKTNERIAWEGFREKRMKPPVDRLQDANAVHYSLQLALYEHILREEGYTDFLPGPIRDYQRYMLWIPPEQAGETKVKPVKAGYDDFVYQDILALLLDHILKLVHDEIPF